MLLLFLHVAFDHEGVDAFSFSGLLPLVTLNWLQRLEEQEHRSAVRFIDDSSAPEPFLSEYNESTALYLAYVTSVSYCSQGNIQDWSCSPCALVAPLSPIHVVEDRGDNFQGLVGYSATHHAVIVAFRGSMDVVNWIDNMTFVKKKGYAKFPQVRVHEGFYWAYQSVEAQVLAATRTMLAQHPEAKLWITGHSLGGAVAALCAFEMQLLQDIPVDVVYTFGEPRVGNLDFAKLLNGAISRVYRVTHHRDIVPHLPPRWLGFVHSTQEIYYDEFSMNYAQCSRSDGEDPTCSNTCSPFMCNSIVDHLTYLNVTMGHLVC